MKKLIELDAALEGLENLNAISFYEANEHSKEAYMETKGMLKTLPTVDAVPVKHGRWIDIDSEMYTWKIRCSNCGHERSMMSTGQLYPMYCENCGTRMDWKDSDNEKTD